MKVIDKNGRLKKHWEDWEIEVLKNYYEKWGPEYCLHYLPDRNRIQVVGKANRLKLLRDNNKRFKGNKSVLNNRTCAAGLGSIECLRCGAYLELNSNNFVYRKDRDQYKTICKQCLAERQRELRSSSITKYLGAVLSRAVKRRGGNANAADLYRLWVKQKGKCSITGLDMVFGTEYFRNEDTKYRTMSLDRIDSSKPYDRDNIQLVCLWVNIAKQTFTLEQLKDWCTKVLNPETFI